MNVKLIFGMLLVIFPFMSCFAEKPLFEKDIRTDKEWSKVLTAKQFNILRKDGTEPAHSSSLNDEDRDGVFICAACKLPLFKSETKYDSKTGWPSFWAPIEGHIETKTDWKLFYPRTEYHCAKCNGHQGHVFKDGPKKHGGKRYCNNGLALEFKPTKHP